MSTRLDNYRSFLSRDLPNATFRARFAWSLLSGVTAPRQLLDLGCGSGEFLGLAASQGVESVCGVEGVAEAIQQARSRGFQVEKVDLDMGELPFPEQRFDAAVCLEVLEHLYHPARTVEQIRRVLARGGWLVVSVPNQYHVATRLRILFGGSISCPMTVGGHIKFFRVPELERLFGKPDWEIRSITAAAYPTAYRRYGWVIRALLRVRPSLFATWFFVLARKVDGSG